MQKQTTFQILRIAVAFWVLDVFFAIMPNNHDGCVFKAWVKDGMDKAYDALDEEYNRQAAIRRERQA